MKTYKQFIYEGIRDMMTPKSEEDIEKSLQKLTTRDKVKVIVERDMIDIFGRERFKKLLLDLPMEIRMDTIINARVRDIYTRLEIKNMFKELSIVDKLKFIRYRTHTLDLFDDGEIKDMLLDYMRTMEFPNYGDKLIEDSVSEDKSNEAIDRACSERPVDELDLDVSEISYTGWGVPNNEITNSILRGIVFIDRPEQRFDAIRHSDENTYNIYRNRKMVAFKHNENDPIWYFNKEQVLKEITNSRNPKMMF